MKCKDIGFGTFNCAYNIMLPWISNDKKLHTVAIDKCLLPEIISLWELGIKTTGCCCGHDKPNQEGAFIGVEPKYINRMKEMGYKVYKNPCRPEDEDSFIPKTKLHYGEIDKGFNLWDR